MYGAYVPCESAQWKYITSPYYYTHHTDKPEELAQLANWLIKISNCEYFLHFLNSSQLGSQLDSQLVS